MSIGFFVDINVLSEFNRRLPPDACVNEWVELTPIDSLYVSV